jgi:ribosomal protein S18 acetylase RimI-like enzyme
VKLAVGLDDTWPMGERHAELYTLTVAEAARGRGVGTRLMDAVDAELANRASPISRSRSWRATDAPSGSTNGAA